MWKDSYEKLTKNNLAWSTGWGVPYGSNQRKKWKDGIWDIKGKKLMNLMLHTCTFIIGRPSWI